MKSYLFFLREASRASSPGLLFTAIAWAQRREPASSAAAQQTETSQVVHHEKLQSQPRKSSRDTSSSGRWLLSSYGSAALGKTSRQVYAAHIGLGYHVVNDLSLNFEGVGYLVNQDRDTGAIGLDLLPRWHYLRGDQWSLYADGGAGVIYSMERMGRSGTHFNFTLQSGFGATYGLSDLFIPMGGMRWFHISKARIRGRDRNVGFDSPMFYLGFNGSAFEPKLNLGRVALSAIVEKSLWNVRISVARNMAQRVMILGCGFYLGMIGRGDARGVLRGNTY